MRVLFVSRQFPWPLNSGGSQRIFHFVRAIARRHSTTLLTLARTPIPGADLEEFQRRSGCATVLTFDGADCSVYGDSIYWGNPIAFARSLLTSPFPALIQDWWSASLVSVLTRFAREQAFDLVVTRDPSFAEQARSVGFPRIILDADDLFSVLLAQEITSSGSYRRKPLHRADAMKARWYERRLPNRFAAVVVAKPDDRDHFATALRKRVVVIPNGIDLPSRVDQASEIPNRILFVGTLTYAPNIDAIRYLVLEVLPRLWENRSDVLIDIVGRGPAHPTVTDATVDPRVRVHESPADLSSFYRNATLVVAPIRTGSGTRIKVLEALAYGKALVATTFAPQGLGLVDGKHFVAADSAESFARVCTELLDDSTKRKALGEAGRAFVAENFDWDRIEQRIGELVDPIQVAS